MADPNKLDRARAAMYGVKEKPKSRITSISLGYLRDEIVSYRQSGPLQIPKSDDEKSTAAMQLKERLGVRYDTLRNDLITSRVTQRQAIDFLKNAIKKRSGDSSPKQIADFFAVEVFELPRRVASR